MLAYNISITNITNASDEEIAEYFRYLQNQERLRAGEIINSVPETSLEKYLNALEDKDKLLLKLSFSNTRKQFDRVYYSILGLEDGQLGFGVMDKDVMAFVADCKELNDDTVVNVRRLTTQLNLICNWYKSSCPCQCIPAAPPCAAYAPRRSRRSQTAAC